MNIYEENAKILIMFRNIYQYFSNFVLDTRNTGKLHDVVRSSNNLFMQDITIICNIYN